jgi:hypothetical protein
MKKVEEPKDLDKNELFYETILTLNGSRVRRLKSNLFYFLSTFSFIFGVALLISEKTAGYFFLFTLFPIFLIYPLVRFFFGGKDSLAGVVVTVVTSELVKQKLINKIDRQYNQRRK